MERDNFPHHNLAIAAERSGYIQQATEIKPLAGGANNRVFQAQLPDQTLIIKSYFHHPKDPRNRLSTEFDFLSYLWEKGIRSIPKPLERLSELHIGIYSCLQGRKADFPVKKEYVQQALQFLLQINKDKNKASYLTKASEACFSLSDYIYAVDRRINNLSSLSPSTSLEQEIYTFITNDLSSFWKKKKKELPTSSEILPRIERIISPSDFGFHNILIEKNENCNFLDFEYAGWDDPIKTLSDFFLQPKIQVSSHYIPWAFEVLHPLFPDPEKAKKRLRLIFPICQIKWLCIMLNSFSELGKKRRAFSKSLEDNKLLSEFHCVKEKFQQHKESDHGLF